MSARDQATDAQVGAVVKVRVTQGGYGMSLAALAIYGLPEGDHWLYAHPPVAPLPPSVANVEAAIASLTEVQRAAIKGAVNITGNWVLTTKYEDHPDITEDLPEDIADCVSGILTPFGEAIRATLSSAPEFAKQMDGDKALREALEWADRATEQGIGCRILTGNASMHAGHIYALAGAARAALKESHP